MLTVEIGRMLLVGTLFAHGVGNQPCVPVPSCYFAYGEFYVIEIHFDVEGIRISLSDCLYSGLPCKALLWMMDVLILALVEMGDGMVLKIEKGALVYKGSIQNIAPFLDL